MYVGRRLRGIHAGGGLGVGNSAEGGLIKREQVDSSSIVSSLLSSVFKDSLP